MCCKRSKADFQTDAVRVNFIHYIFSNVDFIIMFYVLCVREIGEIYKLEELKHLKRIKSEGKLILIIFKWENVKSHMV